MSALFGDGHTLGSYLDRPFLTTFFPNYAANTMKTETLTLRALAIRVETVTASSKDKLPWLKLSQFGDEKTPLVPRDDGSGKMKGGCLRHDANVLRITGVEGDYDLGEMSDGEAVERLEKVRLAAMVYTSPSHTEDAPRWRVLCPTSAALPPTERGRLLARLNGVLGGVLSGESWTLSQSYYYGSVNKNPSHRARLIDGEPIDLRDDLDATAMGNTRKNPADSSTRPASNGTYAPVSNKRYEAFCLSVLDTLRSNAIEGQKHYALLRCAKTLGGIQKAAGFTDDAAWQWLKDALPDTVKDWHGAERTARDALARGRALPLPLEDRDRPYTGNGASRPFAPPPSPAPEESTHSGEDDPRAPNRSPPPDGEDVYGTITAKPVPPPSEDAPESPSVARTRRRSADDTTFVWQTPLDFLADPNSEAPELRHEHIPLALNDFVFDTAARMGVDPTSVALACIVACASVATDDWKLQPKRNDYSWTESPRLWGAIVGDPSILKTPIINATTHPIDLLDVAARKCHADDMRIYKQQLRVAKADKSAKTPEPSYPKLDRYLIEGASVEAITEALRDDDEAHQRAPARKVLCRQDEMSEFFANLDRYRAGGKGGGDRGTYLRLYNGGRYTIDRVGRGTFAIPNWSAGFLGGIQPGPIQNIAKTTTEDGLLQRFLYAVPGPQDAGVDRKPSTKALEQYNTLFPILAALKPPWAPGGKHIQTVVFHEDAHQHREVVDTQIRLMSLMPDTSPQLLAAYGKWRGQFARLALTFHLIELSSAQTAGAQIAYPMVIAEATARQAAAFMLEIALPHLLRAHRLMFSTEQTGHASWIAGYILAQRYQQITTRDVVRAYGALRAPEAREELAAVMASLVTIGWLEPEAPSNLMKPVHTWTVNPAVHVMFADRAEREKARRAKARADIEAHIEALKPNRAEQDEG